MIVNPTSFMGDYYIEDIARLQGKSKATIANYVESHGILVPRRFATIDEATKFEGEVLVRVNMCRIMMVFLG